MSFVFIPDFDLSALTLAEHGMLFCLTQQY